MTLNWHTLFTRQKWLLILVTCIGVFIFFGTFRPFYLSNYPTGDLLVTLGAYTGITAMILSLGLVLVPSCAPKWYQGVVKHRTSRIMLITVLTFLICAGCFVFKVVAGYYDLTLARLITGALAFLVVLALPLSFLYLTESKDQDLRWVQIGSLKIKPEELLFVETKGNYLRIVLSKSGELQTLRCRATFKSLLEQTDQIVGLEQCHRAFLINTGHINTLIRDKHTHKLIIVGTSETIPVSRRYVQRIRQVVDQA